MNTKQQGFTLIELIMVIVILGILAATALPKFVDLGKDARAAALESVGGAIRSTMAMTHAQSLVAGQANAGASTITVEGNSIDMRYGYPRHYDSVNGMDDALNLSSEFTYVNGVITMAGASNSTLCRATYVESSSTVPAHVTVLTSGC